MRTLILLILIFASFSNQLVYADSPSVKTAIEFWVIDYGTRYEALPLDESAAVTHIVGGQIQDSTVLTLQAARKPCWSERTYVIAYF